MKNQMTPRDYELISAYLDNQLGSKERAQFEARLKTEPMLQKELHDIGKTRLLVRNLPKLRAPRNYYISSKVSSKVRDRSLPVRPSLRLAPVMGIVSAIATILLALVTFGQTLLTSTTPVALAPAPVIPQETTVAQAPIQSKRAATESPTEAPSMLMSAPMQSAPTSPPVELQVGETEIPTPTTIYIYAYLPTSTPEGQGLIADQQTEQVISGCGDYLGGSAHATAPGLNCPTPTSTLSFFLESLLPSSTPTPTETSTATSTSSLSPSLENLLPTATPTPSETPTPTPTPTETPSPSAAATPTETPPPLARVAPTQEAAAPSGITLQSQEQAEGNATPVSEQTAGSPGTAQNVSFLRYLLLAVEVSLAAIAVFAGIAAIILRVRAGR